MTVPIVGLCGERKQEAERFGHLDGACPLQWD